VASKRRSSRAFSGLSTAELAEAVSSHWAHLTRMLPSLEEADVHRLLCWELANRRNLAILKRLHQRWTRLRAQREWAGISERWEVP
jgi:hypothetical protein